MTDTKTLEFKGRSFTVKSKATKLPVKAINAWEKNLMTVFVEELLGPEQWKSWTDTDPDMDEFMELANKLGEAYNFESVGESSGSGDSSEKTAEPSPQTSSATTDWISRESVPTP